MKKPILPHLYNIIHSPIGEILLTSNGEGLSGLYTKEHRLFEFMQNGIYETRIFEPIIYEIEEYFLKRKDKFDYTIDLIGTDFQKKIWKILLNIPYGATSSYSEIAQLLNMPKARRAVGAAISKNPICIIVPCHRVIGASGKLTGYAGGLKTKDWLLKHEEKFVM